MGKFNDIAKMVIKEHEQVLMAVDEVEVERLLDEIVNANCIQVFAMGRMKCAARAFVMRLMHIGFDAHVVFDTTCPNIGKGDLLIVNAACTAISYTVMDLAVEAGAKVCSITSQPDSKWSQFCDFVVRLSGQVHLGREGEVPSIQPMAALFEQTIFVFEDIIIQLLMEKQGITAEQMARRHTNLDGYMQMNED